MIRPEKALPAIAQDIAIFVDSTENYPTGVFFLYASLHKALTLVIPLNLIFSFAESVQSVPQVLEQVLKVKFLGVALVLFIPNSKSCSHVIEEVMSN